MTLLPDVHTIATRLSSLEHELHEVEYRMRTDLLTREMAWLERCSSAMSLLTRMIVAIAPTSDPRHRERAVDIPDALSIPDLQPRRITVDEFYALSPEKIELLGGYLLDEPQRRRLLLLLLLNIGLLDAVRLVPEERWQAALERVYGSGA